jgi:hypothetical protein
MLPTARSGGMRATVKQRPPTAAMAPQPGAYCASLLIYEA